MTQQVHFTKNFKESIHIIGSCSFAYLNYRDFDNGHIEFYMDMFIKKYYNYTDKQQEQINAHLVECVTQDDSFVMKYLMNEYIIQWNVNKNKDMNSDTLYCNIECSLYNANGTPVASLDVFANKVLNIVNMIQHKMQNSVNICNAEFLESEMLSQSYRLF
jgi:hypothetical protein